MTSRLNAPPCVANRSEYARYASRFAPCQPGAFPGAFPVSVLALLYPRTARRRRRAVSRTVAGAPGRTRGFTLTELMVAVALLAILGAMAVPPFAARLRTERVRAAALAIRSLLQQARAEAAARAANVAVVFDPPTTASGTAVPGPTDSPVIAVYLDANHNGVRRSEIAAGVESVLQNPWRFGARFPGVRWGAPAGTAGGQAIPGHAVGVAGMVSFSPLGGSGSGRITVSGDGSVYSIVIHGASARIRLERRAGNAWIPA